MAKKKKGEGAPRWKVGLVKRADAGGSLYNAVTVDTHHEYFGIPSYDGEAIKRRVEALNRDGVARVRSEKADPWETLDRIAREIDGQETNSETMSNIIEHLTDAGYDLRDPADMEDTDGD
jgi:hypothetical protein